MWVLSRGFLLYFRVCDRAIQHSMSQDVVANLIQFDYKDKIIKSIAMKLKKVFEVAL